MRYLVEKLGDEMLVYDIEQHNAYALDAKQREQWKRVRGVSARRAFLATVAAFILAPTVAQAASQCVAHCNRHDIGQSCGPGCTGTCRAPGKCL